MDVYLLCPRFSFKDCRQPVENCKTAGNLSTELDQTELSGLVFTELFIILSLVNYKRKSWLTFAMLAALAFASQNAARDYLVLHNVMLCKYLKLYSMPMT